jgi:dienelactone hydrolase
VLDLLLSLVVSPSAQAGAPEEPFADVVDWYRFEDGRRVLLTWGASGGLRLLDFDTPAFEILEVEGGRFRWLRSGSEPADVRFERDERGAVRAFSWSAYEDNGRAERTSDYGYDQVPGSYASGGIELFGLVLLPRGKASSPGAVILQGSGDSDRDNVWAFSIADHLARSGIAVLLPDKRGCGQSRGDWKAVGFDELAGDALAASEVLRARPEVDKARIGLVGLSQGGWIAPLAARRDARVAFIVSVSGAAVTVREQVLHELEATVRESAGDEAAAIALELMGMAFDYGRTGEGWDDYLAAVEGAPPALASAFPTARDDWRWSWYPRVLDFDPLPLWKELALPCLVVYGAEDEHDNVPVRESVRRLDSLGRRDLTVRVFAGSGHALDDPAGTWIRRDFLDALASWIHAARR